MSIREREVIESGPTHSSRWPKRWGEITNSEVLPKEQGVQSQLKHSNPGEWHLEDKPLPGSWKNRQGLPSGEPEGWRQVKPCTERLCTQTRGTRPSRGEEQQEPARLPSWQRRPAPTSATPAPTSVPPRQCFLAHPRRSSVYAGLQRQPLWPSLRPGGSPSHILGEALNPTPGSNFSGELSPAHTRSPRSLSLCAFHQSQCTQSV